MLIMMARKTSFSLHFARCTDSPCSIEPVKNSAFNRSLLVGSHLPLDGQQLGILGPTRIRHHRSKGRVCTKPAGSTVYSLCIGCTTRKVRSKPKSPGNNASPVGPTLELPTLRQAWEARIEPAFVYQLWKGEQQERPQNSHPQAHEE